MISFNRSISAAEPSGFPKLWEFLKESIATEFRSMLGLLVAPLQALRSGSLEPIKSALRSAEEDSERLLNRYIP